MFIVAIIESIKNTLKKTAEKKQDLNNVIETRFIELPISALTDEGTLETLSKESIEIPKIVFKISLIDFLAIVPDDLSKELRVTFTSLNWEKIKNIYHSKPKSDVYSRLLACLAVIERFNFVAERYRSATVMYDRGTESDFNQANNSGSALKTAIADWNSGCKEMGSLLVRQKKPPIKLEVKKDVPSPTTIVSQTFFKENNPVTQNSSNSSNEKLLSEIEQIIENSDDSSAVQKLDKLLKKIPENLKLLDQLINNFYTPLSLAAKEGKCDCMKMLLEYKVDPNIKRAQATPLNDFINSREFDDNNKNHLEMVKLLSNQMSKEAIDSAGFFGETTLHTVCEKNYVNTLKILLASPEISLDLRDDKNRTAYDVGTSEAKEIIDTNAPKKSTTIGMKV